MKHFIYCLLISLSTLTATAQKEVDFVSTFAAQNQETGALSVQTVSPAMMAKLISSDEVSNNKEMCAVLKRLKTIRMATCSEKKEAEVLYRQALDLLKKNENRYQLTDEYDEKSLYTRKKKNTIVEIILLTHKNGLLTIVNLTGNMTEKFLEELKKI